MGIDSLLPYLKRSGVVALFGLAACAAPALQTAPAPAPAVEIAGEALIQSESLRGHVAYLASDELRGRATPSPGLEMAAEYIADHFESLGLRPAGDDGTYFQRYPLASVRMDPSALRFSVEAPDTAFDLTYRTEYAVIASDVSAASGAPVFAGDLETLGDFSEAVRGHIAVARMTGSPGQAVLSAGQKAAAAGAAALIIVIGEEIPHSMLPQFADFLASGTGAGQPIPVALVTTEVARWVTAALGGDYDAAVEAGGPSAPLGATFHLNLPVESSVETPPNVAAILPGSDPALRDSYVVLTAHFDHVGVGEPDASGDSIYNGADDDASGTAVVMAVASALASLPEAPARSVLFLAVSGEEKGLLGSQHFASNPTVPRGSMVANINMDMVGRNAPDSLVVIGDQFTTLGELAYRMAAENPEMNLHLMQDPDPSENVFFRSDHFSFAAQRVPAIFFTTWLHEDYHRPSDELEKLNVEKLERVGRLVYHLTRAVADNPQAPSWTPAGEAAMAQVWGR